MSAYGLIEQRGEATVRRGRGRVKQNACDLLQEMSPDAAWAARIAGDVFVAKGTFYGRHETRVSRARRGERNWFADLFELVRANVRGGVPIETTLQLAAELEAFIHAAYQTPCCDESIRKASLVETEVQGDADPAQMLLHECVDSALPAAYESLTRHEAAIKALRYPMGVRMVSAKRSSYTKASAR